MKGPSETVPARTASDPSPSPIGPAPMDEELDFNDHDREAPGDGVRADAWSVDPEDRAALHRLARGDDPDRVRQAIFRLGQLVEGIGPEATSLLLDVLGGRPDIEVGRSALRALADSTATDEAVRGLAAALPLLEEELRLEALAALARLGGDASARTLRSALADDGSTLVRSRAAAFLAMAFAGHPATIDDLMVAGREDVSPDVRTAAVDALAGLDGPDATAALRLLAGSAADEGARELARSHLETRQLLALSAGKGPEAEAARIELQERLAVPEEQRETEYTVHH